MALPLLSGRCPAIRSGLIRPVCDLLEQVRQLGQGEGLADENCPPLPQLGFAVPAGISAHEAAAHSRVDLLESSQGFRSVQARHPYIRQDEGNRFMLLPVQFNGFVTVGSNQDSEAMKM